MRLLSLLDEGERDAAAESHHVTTLKMEATNVTDARGTTWIERETLKAMREKERWACCSTLF
jgi:hypothetical protein